MTRPGPGDPGPGDGLLPGHQICLVVPHGTHHPDPLAKVIAWHHRGVRVGAIWCGDPQLQPAARVDWWDDAEVADTGWHRTLVRQPPVVAEWLRALRHVRGALDRGAATVTLLWVGAVAVLDDVSALWRDAPELLVVARVTSPLPEDGARPTTGELVESGRFSPHIATFGATSQPIIDWLERRLDESGSDPVGRILELAAGLFGATVCGDPGIGAGAWRWETEHPALLDVAGYDVCAPWTLDAGVTERMRIAVVGHDDRRRTLRAVAEQVSGRREPLAAPGGIPLDDDVRCAARNAPEATVPSPWATPAAFRRWLADHYWPALHASRRDLRTAFPRPRTTDAAAFGHWARRAVIDDGASLLIPPARPGVSKLVTFERVDAPRTDGINLLGYLRRESSLGDVARRLAAATAAAGLPTALLAHENTGSPLLPDAPACGRRIDFATTLAVVNADQFATIELDHPELVAATRRMIGYWFWELEHVPPAMRAVFSSVDEIWAGSRFVVDAFAAVAEIPVRHVPIPVDRPQTSGRQRSSFAPLAQLDDRFVFTVVLDHFSVTERKNPVGAITAFRRAFAPDEGPALVVKTMNGAQRWPQHQRVLAAAEGRPDIIVWDEHLSRPDHMAHIAAADALVSLHRSEGLGLHLAEAMWLGTPTIATRYSGNLDFMDDSCSLLVDAQLVPVQGGEGVYPASAVWAEPDLDVAAEAMRRLAGDAALGARLSAAGRARMEAQPSLADTGRLVAALLRLDVR